MQDMVTWGVKIMMSVGQNGDTGKYELEKGSKAPSP